MLRIGEKLDQLTSCTQLSFGEHTIYGSKADEYQLVIVKEAMTIANTHNSRCVCAQTTVSKTKYSVYINLILALVHQSYSLNLVMWLSTNHILWIWSCDFNQPHSLNLVMWLSTNHILWIWSCDFQPITFLESGHVTFNQSHSLNLVMWHSANHINFLNHMGSAEIELVTVLKILRSLVVCLGRVEWRLHWQLQYSNES